MKSMEIEPKARQPYLLAERALKAKKIKPAADAYIALRKKFPGGVAHQLATYRLGSIYYSAGQYPQAAQEFQSFLTAFPNSSLAMDVSYNLAAAEYQQQHYDKAFEALRVIKPEAIRAQGTQRAELIFALAAQSASGMGNHAAAVYYSAAQLQLPLDESKRRALDANIQASLAQMNSADELNVLLGQISEPGTRSKVGERLAMVSSVPAAPMPGMAPLPGAGEAPTAPGLTGSGASADRSHLGVVLPLSGSLAPYGRKALDAILLAAGVFRRDGEDFEIFVEDSASNPSVAAQAVERLVQEHGVIGIIGPISWKESLAAGDRAQELGVLNLSLTGKEGISERGAYLFQNALTPRVQMENLVKHCIQEKKFHRFAILAPENSFGDDMASEFTAVANRLGGRVVGYETYPPEAKDFQTAVQKLAGLADPRYRKMETQKLEAFVKEQQEKTRRPSKARLPPLVDFDAIFLPDGPKNAAQIAASLAYFDVTGVALLGTSEWNSDQLHKRGGRLVEGALFPAGLSLTSTHAKQRDFVRMYAEAYGGMPDLLSAQAYEAFELVARAASGSGGNRNSAVSELSSLTRFESPLGILSVDASRTVQRTLPILGLVPGGNIVEQ